MERKDQGVKGGRVEIQNDPKIRNQHNNGNNGKMVILYYCIKLDADICT